MTQEIGFAVFIYLVGAILAVFIGVSIRANELRKLPKYRNNTEVRNGARLILAAPIWPLAIIIATATIAPRTITKLWRDAFPKENQ